jgi:two-component system OmpR family sensor kinase
VSLRVRLALVYLALLAVTLGVFSLATYLIAANRLYTYVDDNLTVRAEGLVAALQPLDAPIFQEDIARNRAALDEEASAGAIFQIRDAQGNILYASAQPGSLSLPSPEMTSATESTFLTGEIREQRLRVLYRRIIRDGQILGSVEVAESLHQADEALNQIRNVFIAGGVAVLVLTSASAFWFAGRALDPVRQVSRLARDIERTADFSRRLDEPRVQGEMKELVTTFNAMIGRVERALEAHRAFLADSSHELRRPLTVLRMNIDILNDPALPPEQREVCLREIRREAETMSRLLSDLLLLSREGAQAFDRTFVDYTSLCKEAMARLRTQDNRHDLRSNVAEGVGVVGDKERLAQMLWNLLDNAARYTPDEGRIELRLLRLDSLARLEVEDTGIGISEDDLPHIFDRFYRSQLARATAADGVGLGLSIVKHVAEAHGGGVKVDSQPGRGTTFTVDLPAAV